MMIVTGNSGTVCGWYIGQCETCFDIVENAEYATECHTSGKAGAWAHTIYRPCICGRYQLNETVSVGNVPTNWF